MVGAAFIIRKNSGLSLQERRKLKPPNTAKSRVRVLIWQILKRSSSSKTRNSGSLLFSLLGLLLFRWPFFFISQNFHHNVSSFVFWFSFWSSLQGHVMWLQRQDSFQQKFGTINQGNDTDEQEKWIKWRMLVKVTKFLDFVFEE